MAKLKPKQITIGKATRGGFNVRWPKKKLWQHERWQPTYEAAQAFKDGLLAPRK